MSPIVTSTESTARRRHEETRAAAARRWRTPRAALITALVALLGLGTLMYPSTAAWFSQLEQASLVSEAAGVTDLNAERNAEAIRRAHAYNDALQSGARIEANQRLPLGGGESEAGSEEYLSNLDDGTTGVMTRLRIPKIDVDLPTYHGTSDEVLLKGLGHLEGTSLPVGGPGTHSVITGHRGLADARMFTDLDKIEVGDRFTLTTFGEVLAYQVVETQVVEPDETESLASAAGKDLVTLVTCTPLGINSQRILITAQRVFPTPPQDLEAGLGDPDVPGFPWWAVVLGSGLVLAGGYVWASGRPRRAQR